KDIGVGGEVLANAQGAAKIDNGHEVFRAGIGIDKLLRRVPGLDLVGSGHGGVIKEENQVAAALRICLLGGVGAGRKAGNRLLLIVLVNLEVVGAKVADIVALLVGDDGIDQNQLGFALNDHPALLRRSGWWWRWRRRVLRSHAARQAQQSSAQVQGDS